MNCSRQEVAPVIQPVRLAALKALIMTIVTHPFIGQLIGLLCRDSVCCKGVRVDTSRMVASRVKAMLFWGMYESAEIRFVNSRLDSSLDVVELGSSLGVVSCHIARKATGRKIVCVEANPVLIDVMRRNLDQNVPGADVRVVNAAIDYSSGEGTTYFSIGSTNLASSLASECDGREAVAVRTTSLSALLSDNGIEEYALVMDIEGAEIGLLMRDRAALCHCLQVIAELHETQFEGRRITVDDLIDIMCKECGFVLSVRRGPCCVFERRRDSNTTLGQGAGCEV